MTAMLLQHSIRPQVCGPGFGIELPSVCVLSLVRRLASKGNTA
jgi:hypothetical protein